MTKYNTRIANTAKLEKRNVLLGNNNPSPKFRKSISTTITRDQNKTSTNLIIVGKTCRIMFTKDDPE